MARLARVVAPGIPHHVTQRGNRRQQVFFSDDDYALYRGYLWQGRFASCPMDEAHLLASARYVELNPVRARLARRARDWRWSSARAHLVGEDDDLVQVHPLLALAPDWSDFLAEELNDADHEAIRAGERTGRPLGSTRYVTQLETRLDRPLARQKPGPKPSTELRS